MHAGPNALAKAIVSAPGGATLRIHPGVYHGALTIDKPLTLEAAGFKNPIIDAGCRANDAIHVTSGGVTIDELTVKGAATGFGDYPAEIFFEGTRSGTARDDRLINSCDAQYGVSAFDAGPVDVRGNYARGFDDSGIYIGSITDTLGRTLLVTHNETVHNSRGIVVEDSNLPTVRIRIGGNEMNDNRITGDEGPSDGLFLTNSDGVLVTGNTANGNAGSGYHPNSSSDHNVFDDNFAKRDSVGKLLDEGRRNCGSGDNFPIPAC